MIRPDYFRALGIAVRSGRAFTAGDRSEPAPVAIINETFARQLLPRPRPDRQPHASGRWREGAARSADRRSGGRREALRTREGSHDRGLRADRPGTGSNDHLAGEQHVLGDPDRRATARERPTPCVARSPPSIPPCRRRSSAAWISGWVARSRRDDSTCSWWRAFAAAALLLAVIGVYAVSAFACQHGRERSASAPPLAHRVAT